MNKTVKAVYYALLTGVDPLHAVIMSSKTSEIGEIVQLFNSVKDFGFARLIRLPKNEIWRYDVENQVK